MVHVINSPEELHEFLHPNKSYSALEKKALDEAHKLYVKWGFPPAVWLPMDELLKYHLQLAWEGGYTEGLSLRLNYNDPEMMERVRQQAIKEGYEAGKEEKLASTYKSSQMYLIGHKDGIAEEREKVLKICKNCPTCYKKLCQK